METLELFCLEQNPEFVRIGKRVLPDAVWIEGSFLDPSTVEQLQGARIHEVISNPPYGRLTPEDRKQANHLKATQSGKTSKLELAAMEVALQVAPTATFIVPEMKGSRLDLDALREIDIHVMLTYIDVKQIFKDCAWRGTKMPVDIVVVEREERL